MADTFGKDVFCLDSIRTGRYATGAMLIGQRFYHDLITPRGMLRGGEEEGNFGQDLPGLIGSDVDERLEQQINDKINRAKANDERVASVTSSISTTTDDTGETSVEIDIRAETAAGPFRLVVAITDVSVELLKLTTGE